MLGAIIGDIVGSPYEWHAVKTTDFPLFSAASRYTDDTVMTLAVAEGLMNGGGSESVSEKEIVKAMQKYGRMFPHAGYGGNFMKWIQSDDPQPYNSYGNGSAMRVSAAAWLSDSLAQAERYACVSARVTHNHPEGIKGAKATAAAVFLARTGESKTAVKTYVEETYGYDLGRKLDDIRPGYKFDDSCQGSVPEAMIAFLESDGFEDAIRKAVSLGGDSDTLAAVAGSIAEGFYGIPEKMKKEAILRLDEPLLDVLKRWEKIEKRGLGD
jgi:ADP-ribosylglycohydrolase